MEESKRKRRGGEDVFATQFVCAMWHDTSNVVGYCARVVAFLANMFPASKTVGLSPCAYVNGSMYRHQSSGGNRSGRRSSSSSIFYTILGTVQAEPSLLGLDARCFGTSADMMHYAKTTTMLAAVHIEPPPPHPSVPIAPSLPRTAL